MDSCHVGMIPPASINKLSPEVMIMIFANLSKMHIKNARLVSKEWESLVVHFIPYLYDTVVISPHQSNMDTFLKVAYHPTYSVHIKHLIYDGTCFDDRMNLARYETALRKQFKAFGRTEPVTSELLAEGLAVYQQCTREQETLSTHDELFFVLKIGLRKFSRLRTVLIANGRVFKSSPSEEAFGPGRLCRDWNPLHLRPWDQGEYLLHPWVSEHFIFLLDVLTTTKRQVQDLDWRLWQSVDLAQFSRLPLLPAQLKTDSAAAFRCLRRLNLCIGGPHPPPNEDIAAFSQLLQAADALEEMQLNFASWGFPILFAPLVHAHTWPHLRVIDINSFKMSQSQLLAFLHRHAGTLREVSFHYLELTEGLWADVSDYMRSFLNLSVCRMTNLDGGETDYTIDESKTGEYVVNGGLNPWR